MRFRHWERTQLWRFYAGGGDIVEGRRLRQPPPSCQPQSLHGLTRVYSRGVQPGSLPLPDTRPIPGAPEQGRGRGQARHSAGGLAWLPESSGFPSHRASGVRSRPSLQTGFQRKFVVFLFLLSVPLFPLSGQRQISQGCGPWRRRRRRRGLLSYRGFPSGLSEPVSSPVSRRKEERKTTDPFSSLRLPREGTERVCLSGENREKQAAWQSREEQGGTEAVD